jgi:hypothetical protein
MRTRNTRLYRLAHWPIWIWVFFLAPGPLTFSLFAHGFSRGNLMWLALVLLGTGVAALRGSLPGAEPAPYILRFDEDKPNPMYRRVCYTFAWNAVLSFALLNLAGAVIAVATGTWYMKQIYTYAYAPLCATILILGAAGLLPRVGRSTKGEGTERRYFYGSVWAVVIAQDAAAGRLEDAAPNAHRGRHQARGLRWRTASGGACGLSRSPAAHPAHRPGRIDGCRLICAAPASLRWAAGQAAPELGPGAIPVAHPAAPWLALPARRSGPAQAPPGS